MWDNDKVCRTCLSENISKISILEMTNELIVFSIKDMLMECAAIYVSADDNLPKSICNKCLEILQLSYNFKIQCKKSEEILLSLNETKITTDSNDGFDPVTDTDPEPLEAKVNPKDLEMKLAEANQSILELFGRDNFPLKDETSNNNESKQVKKKKIGVKKKFKLKSEKYASFAKLKKLKRPAKAAGEDDGSQYPCLECNLSYKTRHSLNRHNRKKHLTNAYKCEICNKSFVYFQKYFQHRITHGYPCTTCYELFDDQISLQNHQTVHTAHSNFACKECGKEFQIKEKLFAHYKRHANKNRHLCTICGKTSSSAANFVTHMKSHENNVYTCKICEKSYRSKSSWRYHMYSHDPNREQEHVPCNICGKLFKTKKNLRKHSILHIENRIKKHGCTYCEKRFDRGGDLRTHLRIHTGERPYACTICELKFTQPNVLKNHLKIHENAKM